MNNSLQPKINLVNQYIDKLGDAIKTKSQEEAESLESEIYSVFGDEIDNFTSELSRFDTARALMGGAIDYLKDAKLIRAKLVNYRTNLSCGLHSLVQKEGNTIEFKQIQNTEATLSVEINVSFENTISNINQIPDSVLNQEDKEILQGKIVGIELSKKNGEGKGKLWDKVKPVLEFAISKGADVAIAAIPYLLSVLQNS